MSSMRSRIAANTPAWLRKLVRMAEHYGRRQAEWLAVLHAMRGVSGRDRRTLFASAAASPATALARLDEFQPPFLFGDIEVDVRDAGRFAVRAGTDDLIHLLAAREPAVIERIRALLRPGDVFIDAGANIGFYSMVAARLVGAAGKVVAFEMMPPTLERLRRHIERNQAANVEAIGAALADRDGDTLVATSTPDKFGQASIVADAADDARSVRYEVTTMTLDTALAGIGEIALIKMDLEGAEYLTLRGAASVLSRTGAVLFENNERDSRIFALLEAAGFSIDELDANDWLARRAS